MMDKRLIGGLLALTLVIAGCAGESQAPDQFELTMALVSGFYIGTTMDREEGGVVVDMVIEGAELGMTLTSEGQTLGRLFIPARITGGEDEEYDLTGTWQLNGTTVTVDQEADTFLRDMSFEVAVGDKFMSGEETFGPVKMTVVLAR